MVIRSDAGIQSDTRDVPIGRVSPESENACDAAVAFAVVGRLNLAEFAGQGLIIGIGLIAGGDEAIMDVAVYECGRAGGDGFQAGFHMAVVVFPGEA